MNITWKTVKSRPSAWSHIRCILTGTVDLGVCVICDHQEPLEVDGRERQSVMLELARKHWYKHKLADKYEVQSDFLGEYVEQRDAGI